MHLPKWSLGVLIIFLTSCQLNATPAVAPPTKTFSLTFMPSLLPKSTFTTTALPSPTASATPQPVSGRIAFLGIPDFTITFEEGPPLPSNLYVAEPGATLEDKWHIEPVLNTLTATYRLVASPDSKRLAFVATLEDTDGNGIIAYDGGRGDASYIYVLTDGLLKHLNGTGRTAFTWSPDNQAIAYVGYTLSSSGAIQSSNVYIAHLGDSPPSKLIPDISGVIDGLAWSPNNRYIAVSSSARLFLFDLISHEVTEIPINESHAYPIEIAWAPDGQSLAFVPNARLQTLFLVEVRSLALKSLITKAYYISPPTWSPDGQYLTVSAIQIEGGESNVFAIDIQGGNTYNLSSPGGGSGIPLWSPDGQWILFASHRQNRDGLYLANRSDKTVYFVLDTQGMRIDGLVWLLPDVRLP